MPAWGGKSARNVRRRFDANASLRRNPNPEPPPHLSDGDGLLLHHLVDGCAVGVGHLVELIDAADALVGEHQGAAFQSHFPGHRVSHHRGGQADAR